MAPKITDSVIELIKPFSDIKGAIEDIKATNGKGNSGKKIIIKKKPNGKLAT